MIAVIVSAHTMGLGVIRSLGSRGVPIVVARYDRHDYGQASRYVGRTIDVPHPVADEDAFVDAILRLGRSLGEAVLIPSSDAALAALARSWERLLEHFRPGFPPWELARRVLQKQHSYALAASAGIAVPRTLTPHTEDEAVRLSTVVAFPALIKPTQSHLFSARFGVKMFEVDSPAELLDGYRRATPVCETMIQEIIPGPESDGANYNSYVVDGCPVVEFTARKVRNAPPRFGSPRVVMSQRLPDLLDVGRQVVASLGMDGFSCAEFKLDARTGEWTLLEVNGRHNLSSALAVHTGVDFPWIQYRHLVEGVISRADDFRENVFWIDLGRDVTTSFREWRNERYRFRDYVEPYVGPHVFADWALRDPRPMFMRLADPIRHSRRPRGSRRQHLLEGTATSTRPGEDTP